MVRSTDETHPKLLFINAQIEECAYEFAETEKFIATAEKLLTPYAWKRYDMLILPPSFPFGGMENPWYVP